MFSLNHKDVISEMPPYCSLGKVCIEALLITNYKAPNHHCMSFFCFGWAAVLMLQTTGASLFLKMSWPFDCDFV